MKQLIFFLLVVLLPLSVYSNGVETTQYGSPQEIISSHVLDSIQFKIYNAFVKDMMLQKSVEMSRISEDLLQLSKKTNTNIISYWQGYLQFYQGIFYLQMKQNENAKNEIDKGVDIVTGIRNKSSEDYALLSRLQSISLQFAGMKAMVLSKAMTENSQMALELDSENLRANFVHGCNDFYTPEMYGGGKNAEKYLLKAISLPDQKTPNMFLPSWGKEEAYEMLIKLYIKKEDKDKASFYYKEAIALYPQNYMIRQLEKSIH